MPGIDDRCHFDWGFGAGKDSDRRFCGYKSLERTRIRTEDFGAIIILSLSLTFIHVKSLVNNH